MINKIMNEEKPEYVVVAFDKGKTLDMKSMLNINPEELKHQKTY